MVAPVTEDGSRVAVTPPGTPVTASATAPVKPPRREMVTAAVPLSPSSTVSAAGSIETPIEGVNTAVIDSSSLHPLSAMTAAAQHAAATVVHPVTWCRIVFLQGCSLP